MTFTKYKDMFFGTKKKGYMLFFLNSHLIRSEIC